MSFDGLPANNLIPAIRAGDLTAVITALESGADIEQADAHGFRGLPLRTACFEGHAAIVRELLRRGADTDCSASNGPGAPLRLALRCQHHEIAALLLRQGATVPHGIAIPPAVFALAASSSFGAGSEREAAQPLAAPGIAPSPLRQSPIPSLAEATSDMDSFGTQTRALAADLLFLDDSETPSDIAKL